MLDIDELLKYMCMQVQYLAMMSILRVMFPLSMPLCIPKYYSYTPMH